MVDCRRCLERAIVALAVSAWTGPVLAQAPSDGERLQRLEERLREQDERINRLQKTVDEQREAIARLRDKAVEPPPAPARALPFGVGLRISGYVQADAVLYRQSSHDEINGATGQPLNEDRFSITRARLRADADQGIFSGALELDANTLQGPTVTFVEANVSARYQPDPNAPPFIKATLGLFKIPFGAEGPASERSRLFLERSTVVRALFPGNYDLGVMVQGGYRFFRYALAAMNGEPVGQAIFPGRDPTSGKDLMGRLGADTWLLPWLRVEAGVSALAGQGLHRGTPATKDVLVWRDVNENGLVEITEIQVLAGNAATASERFPRFAIGADARVTAKLPVVGALSVYAELIRAKNLDRGIEVADPVSAGRDLRELGFHVAFTQELTRYAMIGVRYDRYNPDEDASEQRAANRVERDSAYTTLSIAAAFRYSPSSPPRGGPSIPPFRLITEYDHRSNALGRTPGGLPTTLGDDSFAIRGEVSF